MSICDKINTAGEALQDNLNARGITCTYGNDTGEYSILGMANLINTSNLKGIGDNILHITASRPYLLEDETTDITVKLHNGVGTPLSDKTITISDGTNTHTGETNTDGELKLYDVTVSSTKTFTATYSTVSATCQVALCSFVDYGTDNLNDNWDATGNLTFTRGTDTTLTLTNTGSIGQQYKTISTVNAVEFDLYTNNTSRTANIMSFRNGTTSLVGFTLSELGINNTGYHHIKLAVSGSTVTPYVDGVAKTAETMSSTPNRFYFAVPSGGSMVFKYKNFSIR